MRSIISSLNPRRISRLSPVKMVEGLMFGPLRRCSAAIVPSLLPPVKSLEVDFCHQIAGVTVFHPCHGSLTDGAASCLEFLGMGVPRLFIISRRLLQRRISARVLWSNQISVSQTLAFAQMDYTSHLIFSVQRTGVVPTSELGHIAVQMFPGHLVIRTFVSALEHCPERLYSERCQQMPGPNLAKLVYKFLLVEPKVGPIFEVSGNVKGMVWLSTVRKTNSSFGFTSRTDPAAKVNCLPPHLSTLESTSTSNDTRRGSRMNTPRALFNDTGSYS